MSFVVGRSGRRQDIEAGNNGSDDEASGYSSDPFLIPRTKGASTEALRRWRQAALVVNASRQFRYTSKQQTLRNTTPHEEATIRELASLPYGNANEVLEKYGGVTGLESFLKTNLEKGIKGEDDELTKRRKAFGSNKYPRKKGSGFWTFVWDACKDVTLIMLTLAAVASLALGITSEGIKEGWYDGGSIVFAIILVIMVIAVSDYKQSLRFLELNEEKRDIHIEVIRNGRRVQISIYDLVVGDVVPLNIGNQVPADGVFITGHSLAIDESSMIGENKIVHKDSKHPFLMSGCKVADGSGTMLVTAVGMNTEWGNVMSKMSEDTTEETPLQVRLNGVATKIGAVGLLVAFAVLVVLVIRFFSGETRILDGSVDAVREVIKILTLPVIIAVVAVPEGLPLAVTLTLAYSMRKMMADKALVRRLSACETMGSATIICCDKTGTLTLNQMSVADAYIGRKKMDPPHNKSELSPQLCSLLLEGVAYNTNGSVYVPQGDDTDGDNVEVSGSPTDKAILHWGIKMGMDFHAIRSEPSIMHVFPFNSEKKRGGVADDSKVHVHWKGAAEIVLGSCTSYMDANGQLVEMDQEKMEFFEKAIEDMAGDSLRCVAIAYKDPCRPGVKEAVQLCLNSGVKVQMVTGDNLLTAKAIARECGILDLNEDAAEPNVVEGHEFRALSDTRRDEIVEKISVMGRSSPNDKLLLVQALRRKGHVVAVTGDGTNDAPALHEADIGLAMGIQGSEVAKESSDIIIMDDNFATVVKVMRWGRSVYANTQKFMQFQLTVNVVAITIEAFSACFDGLLPLNAVQLLWINLIMDTLGALALATEPPLDDLMNRPPVPPREPLITDIMWRNMVIQIAIQVFALSVLNFHGISILLLQSNVIEHAIEVKNTAIFNSFVFFQISTLVKARNMNEFNIFKGITRNYLLLGIVGSIIFFQFIIIEFLGKFTKTVSLNGYQWFISVLFGMSGKTVLTAKDLFFSILPSA
ncbi:calcium-transporting ATPase 10, plasma membrane-type-like isoform X1 [Senna tora]|uniref:Calcium-transporting ATPase n=1 Tax=Senna tora TaxID=362788 RepID=A0A834SLQ3_9FABA|nr:calcium-transporting ATPase 10, plasma membrane-type-like isoform X1 [Senna tora]